MQFNYSYIVRLDSFPERRSASNTNYGMPECIGWCAIYYVYQSIFQSPDIQSKYDVRYQGKSLSFAHQFSDRALFPKLQAGCCCVRAMHLLIGPYDVPTNFRIADRLAATSLCTFDETMTAVEVLRVPVSRFRASRSLMSRWLLAG